MNYQEQLDALTAKVEAWQALQDILSALPVSDAAELSKAAYELYRPRRRKGAPAGGAEG